MGEEEVFRGLAISLPSTPYPTSLELLVVAKNSGQGPRPWRVAQPFSAARGTCSLPPSLSAGDSQHRIGFRCMHDFLQKPSFLPPPPGRALRVPPPFRLALQDHPYGESHGGSSTSVLFPG